MSSGLQDDRARTIGEETLVSVVIATRNRPRLLVRAVESALSQTLRDLEVLVILDGPQPEAQAAMEAVGDTRLRVCALPQPVGFAGALNVGAREARSPWVAILDDDDLWMPGKLAVQLEAAGRSRAPHPIITTRVVARSERGDRLWPRRILRTGEPLADYLFVRRTPFGGEGLVLPSAMMIPRDLVARCPFRDGLRTHVDVDWLLRAAALPGVGVEFVDTAAPQVVWHIDEGRERISTVHGWRESLRWIRENRALVTPAAYAAFVLTWIPMRARRDGEWRAVGALLADAFSGGRPSINDLVTFAAIWLLPRAFVQRAAFGYARLHGLLARRGRV